MSLSLCTKNKAATVEAAIQSVRQQARTDWRLTVVDDGSADQGPAIVEALCKQDARITLIRQPNGGVSAARNLGVAQSPNELVAFLDADDQWLPGHLDNLMALHAWVPHAPMWAVAYRLVDDVGMDRPVRTRGSTQGRYLIDDYSAESVALELPRAQFGRHGVQIGL
ncbi:MAG: glycosyltransferase family 2 protein [Aquabacterium sp.]